MVCGRKRGTQRLETSIQDLKSNSELVAYGLKPRPCEWAWSHYFGQKTAPSQAGYVGPICGQGSIDRGAHLLEIPLHLVIVPPEFD